MFKYIGSFPILLFHSLHPQSTSNPSMLVESGLGLNERNCSLEQRMALSSLEGCYRGPRFFPLPPPPPVQAPAPPPLSAWFFSWYCLGQGRGLVPAICGSDVWESHLCDQ